MGKPPTKELRAKYLTAGGASEPQPLPVIQPQVEAVADRTTLLYEMLIDGKSVWHNIHDAAICFCMNDEMGIGSRVKDSSSSRVRPMTAEERQKIIELSLTVGHR